MNSLENANATELANRALNFTTEEWQAVLAAAPLDAIVSETEYRLQSLQYGIQIFKGGSKTWN